MIKVKMPSDNIHETGFLFRYYLLDAMFWLFIGALLMKWRFGL